MPIAEKALSTAARAMLAASLLASAGAGRAEAETAKTFIIKTADGVPLTDADGRGEATPAASALGLLNIVGRGTGDAAALSGLLGRTALADGRTEVTLTIDSRAQKIVQDTIAYHLTRVIDDKDKPRPFFADRRAAVIAIDVETGAIVASGNWPPPGTGAADDERIARETPRRDPAAISAWRMMTGENIAGAAFAPVLALAAALEASDAATKPDDRIAAMLLGLDRAAYRRRLGLDPASSRVPIAGSTLYVQNAGGTAGPLTGPLRVATCVGEGAVPAASTLNASLAIKHSVSTYFARLALLLEERSIAAWSQTNPGGSMPALPPTRLVARLKQIGLDPDGPLDLAANLGAAQPLARLRGDGVLDKLFATAPVTDLGARSALPADSPRAAYRAELNYRVARSGIGEGWMMTPLQLALGAAVIARGERVSPYLIAGWGETKLGAPPPRDGFAVRPDLLAVIRAGMKAVTEAPGATQTGIYASEPKFLSGQPFDAIKDGDIGRRADALRKVSAGSGVKPIWCRAYGKSGTADGSNAGTNTGWSMGWKEPLQPGGRRLAYACMVTHLDHAFGGPRFGGAVCGALLRDIQLSFEILDRPDLKAE